MYVHVTTDGALYYGQPPETATNGARSWDLSDRDPARMAAAGWYEVDVSPRPADTDEITHDGEVVVTDGIPTHAWVARPWTEAEIAARIRAAERDAQQAADRAALDAIAHTAAAAHTDGDPWTKPTGAHDAYATESIVTHEGKTWESLTPYNVWEPGVSGWREQVAQGYPAWVQPTGAHDAYDKGDPVSFEGSNYESLIDNNTWSPSDYPAGWKAI